MRLISAVLCLALCTGVASADWKQYPSQPDRWYNEFGCWDLKTNKYAPYDWQSKQYGDWTNLPQSFPTGVVNFGVTPAFDGGYSRKGQPITRDDALAAVSKPLVDTSGKVRIVVIGNPDDRKKATALIGKPDWAVVTEHAPNDPYIKAAGFVNGGTPSVYALAPNGDVLHRQDDVRGLQTAIARTAPNYDPKTDPDLRNAPAVASVKTHAICGGGGLLAGLILPTVAAFVNRKRAQSKADAAQAQAKQIADAIHAALNKGGANAGGNSG